MNTKAFLVSDSGDVKNMTSLDYDTGTANSRAPLASGPTRPSSSSRILYDVNFTAIARTVPCLTRRAAGSL